MTTLTEIIMDNIGGATGYESISTHKFTYSITLEHIKLYKRNR